MRTRVDLIWCVCRRECTSIGMCPHLAPALIAAALHVITDGTQAGSFFTRGWDGKKFCRAFSKSTRSVAHDRRHRRKYRHVPGDEQPRLCRGLPLEEGRGPEG